MIGFAKPTDDQSWPIRLHESYKFWWITLKSLYVSQVGQGVGGDETWASSSPREPFIPAPTQISE